MKRLRLLKILVPVLRFLGFVVTQRRLQTCAIIEFLIYHPRFPRHWYTWSIPEIEIIAEKI